MKVCGNNHYPIAFNEQSTEDYPGEYHCPLCRANSHIEEMEKEIGELKSEITELKVERAAIYGKPGRENEVLFGSKAQVDADNS